MLSHPDQIAAMMAEIYADFTSPDYPSSDGDPFGAKKLAVDTEFIRESSFYPIVEVLQVATWARSYVIDVQAFKEEKLKHLNPLIEIFQDQSVLKVMHAAQGDQECLLRAYQILATPVLDTAVAASLAGFGESIGLRALLESALQVNIPKGLTRTNWSKRPLSPQVIEYAHLDVIYLVELCDLLVTRLQLTKRVDLAMQVSAKYSDVSYFEVSPLDLAIKTARTGRWTDADFSRLVELTIWREHRVRELNLPRRWVADDQVLVDIARTRPRTIEELASFRGLGRGELKHQGRILLELTHKDYSKAPPYRAPQTERREILSAEEALILECLKTYVAFKSERLGMGLKQFFTVLTLTKIIKLKPETYEELVASKLIPEEILVVLGQELFEFSSGQLGLRISSQVELFRV